MDVTRRDGSSRARMRMVSDNVQSMDNTRDVTQNGQTNVNEQVGTTSPLQENTQRRQDDGEDDLADVAAEFPLASRFPVSRSRPPGASGR